MPNLSTPVKNKPEINFNSNDKSSLIEDKDTEEKVYENPTFNSVEVTENDNEISSTSSQENKREKFTKIAEISKISSTSFQQAEISSEVEFCRNSSNIQICQTSQSDKESDKPISSKSCAPETFVKHKTGKDNHYLDDINPSISVHSTVKPSTKKEPSGAEKKKTKLKREFLANLSIATPKDPESEKLQNEQFALAYYDKLHETLESEDCQKVMQILNEFESGDVVELYNDIQTILRPKYTELADEFVYFLREKESAIVGQLISWLEVQARVKFCHKLEIYFKDQPTQLRKIYNSLKEFTQMKDLSMEKIKSVLLPMFKGNAILSDLFLQSFRDERPPPSLLEGPYETFDINKELARQENEEIYEKIVVPNTEDKYGGLNCICHCHKIEDNEYKSRYKHCNSCGLRFIQGKIFVQTGRGLHPATVSFKTSPNINHNVRLLGKLATTATSHRKKRSDTSPSKQVASAGKENLDEDTEDEEVGKRKRSISQKTPRKRKKADSTKNLEGVKSSPKKSPGKNSDGTDCLKDNVKSRKRTYSGKRARKEEGKKSEGEVAPEKIEEVEVIVEVEENRQEVLEENQERNLDECMDSSGESLEKPLTPGQQTAESESEIYCEESSQDNYESDSSSSSMESVKGSQSDCNTNDEPPWKREEDTIILETFQREDDKEYALQIISDKLPHRTRDDINGRFSRLMDLLLETLKQN